MRPQKPRFVAVKSRFLRRRRIAKGARDAEEGRKDTEARGIPSDVPARKRPA